MQMTQETLSTFLAFRGRKHGHQNETARVLHRGHAAWFLVCARVPRRREIASLRSNIQQLFGVGCSATSLFASGNRNEGAHLPILR
jgi:hypothetical protein